MNDFILKVISKLGLYKFNGMWRKENDFQRVWSFTQANLTTLTALSVAGLKVYFSSRSWIAQASSPTPWNQNQPLSTRFTGMKKPTFRGGETKNNINH